MKFTKLSLAALVAMGIASSASAIENVKVDGDVKLWYQTSDFKADGAADNKNDGLFKKDGSSGDLAVTLKMTGDLTKRAGFGVTMNALTTLGLENHIVNSEAAGSTTQTAGTSNLLNGTDANPMWFSEMYMTYKVDKTLAKIGRQELNTPLCYTETWGAVKNTFEAAVLVNQNIPDTTLVAAMVSRGNGGILNGTGTTNSADFKGFFSGTQSLGGAVTQGNTTDNGAFAIGMVNKSVPNLTIHPVYYDVTRVGKAFWADVTYDLPKIVKVEALYANIAADKGTFYDTNGNAGTSNYTGIEDTTTAYAVKVSGNIANVVTLSGAYSQVGKGLLNVWNFATYANAAATTKIYTAGAGGTATGAIAGLTDTTGWKVDASTKFAGVGMTAYYNSFKVKNDDVATWKEINPSSYGLIVDTKVDEIDLHLAYISEDKIGYGAARAAAPATPADINAKQQVVRVAATLKF